MASLGSNLRSEEQVAVEVPGVRLDDAVPLTADDRLVAWIDVEGALGAVLPGAARRCAARPPSTSRSRPSPCGTGSGWTATCSSGSTGIGMVPLLRDRQRREQYNVLLVPGSAAATPEVDGDRAPGPAPGTGPGTERRRVPRTRGATRRFGVEDARRGTGGRHGQTVGADPGGLPHRLGHRRPPRPRDGAGCTVSVRTPVTDVASDGWVYQA